MLTVFRVAINISILVIYAQTVIIPAFLVLRSPYSYTKNTEFQYTKYTEFPYTNFQNYFLGT